MSNEVETVEARADRLVRQEVQQCLSSLVYTLAKGAGGIGYAPAMRELEDLCEQAMELASPIQDYEAAAREAGWSEAAGEPEGCLVRPATAEEAAGNYGQAVLYAHGWEGACEEDDLEPHDREVFEHWAVSDWFGGRLKDAGEKVENDFAGMTVWARTTTGQMISMDGVIRRIAAELLRD